MKKAFFQLHMAVFLAGFTAILGLLIELNEILLVWYRLLLTVFILSILMWIRKEWQKLAFRDILRISGVGMVIAIHWVSFYGSIKYANASVALVCLSASGFFTALLEPLFFRRKIVWQELALGILAIAGIYIIFDFHPQYKTGIIFGVLSAFGSAVFPILNKELLKQFTPKILTVYELSGGLVLLSCLAPFYLAWFPAEYYVPTISDWAWLVVLAFFCTVISFDLQLNALKKISAFTANLTYNLEPVYGIILAFVFFDESKQLHGQFYLGLGLIVLAIVLQMLRVLHQARAYK